MLSKKIARGGFKIEDKRKKKKSSYMRRLSLPFSPPSLLDARTKLFSSFLKVLSQIEPIYQNVIHQFCCCIMNKMNT